MKQSAVRESQLERELHLLGRAHAEAVHERLAPVGEGRVLHLGDEALQLVADWCNLVAGESRRLSCVRILT